jgi:hypothetical protein
MTVTSGKPPASGGRIARRFKRFNVNRIKDPTGGLLAANRWEAPANDS